MAYLCDQCVMVLIWIVYNKYLVDNGDSEGRAFQHGIPPKEPTTNDQQRYYLALDATLYALRHLLE